MPSRKFNILYNDVCNNIGQCKIYALRKIYNPNRAWNITGSSNRHDYSKIVREKEIAQIAISLKIYIYFLNMFFQYRLILSCRS